jgi:hypothetical protein
MLYNNKKYLIFLKNSLMISGIVLLIIISISIFFQQYEVVLALSAVLIVALILNRILNISFVRIQEEHSKLKIKFYSLFSVDRNYEAIEFPISSLRHVTVKKYLFGMKWDLYLTVKLKQGMATYPAICLSAVPSKDRKVLVEAISELIPH